MGLWRLSWGCLRGLFKNLEAQGSLPVTYNLWAIDYVGPRIAVNADQYKILTLLKTVGGGWHVLEYDCMIIDGSIM